MAIGVLGSASLPVFGSPTITVYTVPAGISHAVVHITLSPGQFSGVSARAFLNGVVIMTTAINFSGTTYTDRFGSVSMMLSPGDVITASQSGGTGLPDGGCTVTGYEVP
jgi:hypothetical protein